MSQSDNNRADYVEISCLRAQQAPTPNIESESQRRDATAGQWRHHPPTSSRPHDQDNAGRGGDPFLDHTSWQQQQQRRKCDERTNRTVDDNYLLSSSDPPSLNVAVRVVEPSTHDDGPVNSIPSSGGASSSRPTTARTKDRNSYNAPHFFEAIHSFDVESNPNRLNSQSHSNPRRVEEDLQTSAMIRSIQVATTLLCALLLPAAVLSVCVMHQYRLLIVTFWILVWCLFGSLIVFLQYVTHHPTVLHPTLHKFARAVMDEYTNFVDDWKTQVLLLTNGDEVTQNGAKNTHNNISDDGTNNNASSASASATQASRRPKSRIFRALVQPLVPFLTRRNQKKRERKERRQQRTAAAVAQLKLETPPGDDVYQLV